jgi:acyl-CoA reductase-like NAD-dependent aldehyde dehydrogenase
MTTQLAESAADVRRYDLFIDGKFVPAASGKTFLTTNPANGEVVGEIAEGDAADIDKAVAAARACYENVWSQLPVQERGKLLLRVGKLIQDRLMDLAAVESLDMGGPQLWTMGTAMQAVDVFEYWAGWRARSRARSILR